MVEGQESGGQGIGHNTGQKSAKDELCQLEPSVSQKDDEQAEEHQHGHHHLK